MRRKVLKALVGKHICATHRLCYCHVHDILIIEGNRALVTAVIRTHNARTIHWILEVGWKTDRFGEHSITNIELVKEDEIVGYPEHTAQDQAV